MPRILRNGYTVVAEKPDSYDNGIRGKVVLALSEDDHQYATWWENPFGETYHGDYFPIQAYADRNEQFAKASQAFLERKGI